MLQGAEHPHLGAPSASIASRSDREQSKLHYLCRAEGRRDARRRNSIAHAAIGGPQPRSRNQSGL
eukprot:9615145-Alexandrium_andersonii.AAC.1